MGADFALGYAKAVKNHLLGGFFVPAVFAPDGHVQPGAENRAGCCIRQTTTLLLKRSLYHQRPQLNFRQFT